MKNALILVALLLSACGGSEAPKPAAVTQPQKAPVVASRAGTVFIGDSIIARWGALTTLVPGSVNKGIGGQTTAQMLARFKSDVLDLRPAAVVLEGGVNDLVSVLDPAPDNTAAMIQAAQAEGVKVIVLAVLPAEIPFAVWEYNVRLKAVCATYGVTYIDTFYPFMDGDHMRLELFLDDRIHLNDAGYDVLARTVTAAL